MSIKLLHIAGRGTRDLTSHFSKYPTSVPQGYPLTENDRHLPTSLLRSVPRSHPVQVLSEMSQQDRTSRMPYTDEHYVQIIGFVEQERAATDRLRQRAEIAAMRAQERLHASNYMLRAARSSLEHSQRQNQTLREAAQGAIRCVDELCRLIAPFFTTHTQLSEEVQRVMLRSDHAFSMIMSTVNFVDLAGETTEEE